MTSLIQAGQRSQSFENEWMIHVNPTVTALLKEQPVTPRQWHDLFTSIYNLYSWIDNGEEKIKKALRLELRKDVDAALTEMRNARDDHEFLARYVKEWNRYFNMTNFLPLAFRIVDSESTKTNGAFAPKEEIIEKPDSSREMMLETWMSNIFESVHAELLTICEKLIEEERNNKIVDANNASLIVGIRNSFFYLCEKDTTAEMKKKYEKSYVENAINYYAAQSAECMRTTGVRGYLDYADSKILEEQKRAKQYLATSEEADTALTEGLVKSIICTFEQQILALCPQLIAEHDYDLLGKMYRLIKMTPEGMTAVEKDLQAYISREGIEDMKGHVTSVASDPEKYVSQLLKMFEKYSTLVAHGFNNDPRLLTSRDKAFREVVNDTTVFHLDMQQNKRGRNIPVESKCPELLANFCDLVLRRNNVSKKMSSEEVDSCLDEVLLVLKYVDNKDVFMRFYRSHLSRRLILDISSDMEKEETMVNRLREKGMPHEHIHKLSRMLQDIETNKSTNTHFKKHLDENRKITASSALINLKVLNSFAWGRGGTEQATPITLPRELDEYAVEAEDFYKQLHPSRKLAWMHHWAFGVLNFVTNDRNLYDLEVTTAQMCILMKLNDRNVSGITLEHLRTSSALPDSELKRTLQSLTSNPRMKDEQILNCNDGRNPNNWTDSSMFCINYQFKLLKNGQLQPRGKVNLIGQLRLVLEPKTGDEYKDITTLRECRVQEAVIKNIRFGNISKEPDNGLKLLVSAKPLDDLMRSLDYKANRNGPVFETNSIMKSRKTISSAQLQTEVIELLKGMFVPHKQLIKSQVDWLLENGLIERCQKDMNSFQYIV